MTAGFHREIEKPEARSLLKSRRNPELQKSKKIKIFDFFKIVCVTFLSVYMVLIHRRKVRKRSSDDENKRPVIAE